MSVLRDTRIVFGYHLRLLLREPGWLIVGLIQPLLYLALFGPLLGPLTRVPGFPPGDAWQVFVPGLIIQLAIFGSLFVGFGIIAEIREGVFERMRVTPASRFALLFGRVLRDTLILLVQAAILAVIAVAFGLRIHPTGILVATVLVTLLGIALSSLSYAAGMWLNLEDALARLLNMLVVPVQLLSGVLLPMTLGPGWLYNLSRANPFVHVVDASRAAFRGDFAPGTLLPGLLVAAALAVLGMAVATRRFNRQSA